MRLTVTDHLHAIEYYRQHDNGHREHLYTEVVNDHGFVFVHDPDRRERWLANYARVCAEDYLAGVRAEQGRWLVHVYRVLDEQRHHLVSIRMHWRGPDPALPP